MTVGPIQVIFFGFDRIDQFHGEVLQNLSRKWVQRKRAPKR